jgi:magnesium-dependent phosphatase 1
MTGPTEANSVLSGGGYVGATAVSAVVPSEAVASVTAPVFDFAAGPLPSLCVFDLDWTLWPFDCGVEFQGPFTKWPGCGILDLFGRPVHPYKDVCGIMAALVDANVPIAIASRNPGVSGLQSLLRLISFECKRGTLSIWDAIAPGCFHAYSSSNTGGKNKHFAALRAASGVMFDQMVFFDDMPDNIMMAQKQGTLSCQVGKNGLTWDAVTDTFRAWRDRR